MSWNEKDNKSGPNSMNQCHSKSLNNEENISSNIISDLQQRQLPSLYHGAWPIETEIWNSLQFRKNLNDNSAIVASVISFKSNTSIGINVRENVCLSEENHDPKIDVIYSLLGMLLGDATGREDTSNTLLSLSNTVENCLAMRQSGCLPLLVQLIHAPEHNLSIRKGASQALNNIVRATQDEKLNCQELQVLKLIEQLRDCSQALRIGDTGSKETSDRHRQSVSTIFILTKLSYTERYRHIMCQLGGLHAIAELIEIDHLVHGSDTTDTDCLSLRKYTGMTLTNLTYGDSKNKSLLCSFSGFIKVWVAQLQSANEDLHQYTASVLRNLSWRADSNSKKILREMGSVVSLTKAAMVSRHELTLKSILSALWNLSAHCTTNKADICNVDGALSFLVDLLSFKSPSNKLAIVENAGGILRNVSSHVAMEENYRKILREKNSINILVRLLSSPSLTVVSNACGTLWNLSARCPKDQKTLWELGTVPILRNLVHSKHKMISMGASATLRNLLVARSIHGFHLSQSSFQRSYNIPTSRSEIMRIRNHPENRSLMLGTNYRSRSVEVDLEEQEKRSLSNKSWPASFSRHPISPLSCDDDTRNGDENDKSVERRKGSPVDSTFYDRRCSGNTSYEEGDQPIDYSKKYMEQGAIKREESMKMKSRREKFREGSSMLGDYAETDLDQPTDYSLRYAEDDTDEEDKQNDNYYQVNGSSEDTVKTYYTEGTPYETPCNFSTATSMSDLRLEESKDLDISGKICKKVINETIEEHKEINHGDEQHILTKNSHLCKNNSEEKIDYYEQGTPGIVSRVNSLSSLESGGQNDDRPNVEEVEEFKQKPTEDESNTESALDSVEDKENKSIEEKNSDKEAKVVTFGGENHYTDETPLMFSRSSSLGSLSGFEQFSINDDRSSVISDFSRRTSGIVSPSELPDSPTQTVPPSPPHSNKPMNFSPRATEERCLGHFNKFSYTKSKPSVFEDNTAAFKEESTPIEFSAATSLSSLTIDDEPKFPEESSNDQVNLKTSDDIEEAEVHPVAVSPAASSEESSHPKKVVETDRDNEQVSDGDEEDEDEDILAACINMGMQNNRYRQSVKKTEFKSFPSTSVSNLIRYQTSSTLDRLENINISEMKQSNLSPIRSKTTLDISTSPDTVHVYCTEDTPADISPVGSQSNLSALSMPSILEDFEKPENLDDVQNDLSDDSSNLSGDDEQILDECIQSAMPKRVSPISLVCKKNSQVFLSRPNDFSQNSSSSATRNSCEYLVRTVDGRDDDSNNSFDDSPNHSDDDAILAECIESAMPKGRLSLASTKASTSRQSDTFNEQFEVSGGDELKSPRSEDSLSLSEDEENMILAQCIQSGMPKGSNLTKMFSPMPKEDFRVLYSASKSTNCSPHHIVQQSKELDPITPRDETWNFATEDTPCNFSVISEISNLTISST
ncbi:adenomatous polyposis coli protein-like [Chelonus insularis]|uniref:adenomatous polyposis coli protein-like n=1 Tax=Chelonus insularis TaxID=460826 RepID=UPI00158B4E13|nr:adenomatous polyposis coli protein-like [Chelonus insularis]